MIVAFSSDIDKLGLVTIAVPLNTRSLATTKSPFIGDFMKIVGAMPDTVPLKPNADF